MLARCAKTGEEPGRRDENGAWSVRLYETRKRKGIAERTGEANARLEE